MSAAQPKFVEVYRARNLAQAHAIRLALEAAEIPVQIQGELLQGAMGELPLGWNTAPRIEVEESQVEAARAIIATVDSEDHIRSDHENAEDIPHCLACGAEMDDAGIRCASCGWSYVGHEDS
jgi:hypothetical protein